MPRLGLHPCSSTSGAPIVHTPANARGNAAALERQRLQTNLQAVSAEVLPLGRGVPEASALPAGAVGPVGSPAPGLSGLLAASSAQEQLSVFAPMPLASIDENPNGIHVNVRNQNAI